MFYTHTEDFISDLYAGLSIDQPEQLNVTNLSQCLRVRVYYSAVSFRFGKNIVLKKSNAQKEWQSFGHEIGHYLRHHGNQLQMHYLFRDLQEWQANHFSYHFCVPTFMLARMGNLTVSDIANAFNVEHEFARKRLEMYKNNIIGGMQYVREKREQAGSV